LSAAAFHWIGAAPGTDQAIVGRAKLDEPERLNTTQTNDPTDVPIERPRSPRLNGNPNPPTTVNGNPPRA